MQENIFTQGLELMLYGMGTVVVFLSLLVVATGAMSSLITRFFAEQQTPVRPSPQRAPQQQEAGDGELIAVIGAAIQRHRQRHGR